MIQDENQQDERTVTVETHKKDESGNRLKDVTSDPALDTRVGSDWSDEGGATPEGPASVVEK